jgi:DNA replication licensing factor MCM4
MSEGNQGQQILWGTNINLQEISNKIRSFFTTFKLDDRETEACIYIQHLMEIKETEVYILQVDGRHINKFDSALYYQITNFPTEMIPIMDIVANQVYSELTDKRVTNLIQTRLHNLIFSSRIRDLGPDDIDRLISITGLVIRNSEIIPDMKEAYFKCSICGKVETVQLQRGKITEPNECLNCKTKFSYELMHNRSFFTDKQHVKLQETPEHMPEGETPLTVHLCSYDELVDFVKPGDRCEVIGIFRAQGLRVNPKTRVTKSIYRTYIDVVSFTKYNKKKLNIEDDENEEHGMNVDMNEVYHEQYQPQIEELARNPDVYSILCDSFSPNIWENEDVKKGLLLQLFGGVGKDFSATGRGRFRGDVNVLLVGDPSTAKSQLLQYVHNLAPRGIYTSGKVKSF